MMENFSENAENIVMNRLLNSSIVCFRSDDIRIPSKYILLKNIIHSERSYKYHEASYMNKDVMVKEFIFVNDYDNISEKLSLHASILLDATCLSSFIHENIVFFYGASLKVDELHSKRSIMLVMEYCSNGTLQGFLPMIESNWAVKLCIARDILKAIAFLHQKDMIHGNILSHNIFITGQMIAKLVDFSHIHNQHCSSSLGSSSDIYAFGLVLLELITPNLNDYYATAIINPYLKLFCEKGDVLVNVDLEDHLNVLYMRIKAMPILPSCPNALHKLVLQCCNPCAMSRPTAAKCIEELDIMLIDIGLHTNEWHYPHFNSIIPALPDASSIPPVFCSSSCNSYDGSVRSLPPSPPPSLFDEESNGTRLSTMVAEDSTVAEVPVVVLILDENIADDISVTQTVSQPVPLLKQPYNTLESQKNLQQNGTKLLIPTLDVLTNSLKDDVPVKIVEENLDNRELIVPSKSSKKKIEMHENRQLFLENKIAELENKLELMSNLVVHYPKAVDSLTSENEAMSSLHLKAHQILDESSKGLAMNEVVEDHPNIVLSNNRKINSIDSKISENLIVQELQSNDSFSDSALAPVMLQNNRMSGNPASLDVKHAKQREIPIHLSPENSNHRPREQLPATSTGLLSVQKPSLTPGKRISDLAVHEVDADLSPSTQTRRTLRQIQPSFVPSALTTIAISDNVPNSGHISSSVLGLESPVPSVTYKKTNTFSNKRISPLSNVMQLPITDNNESGVITNEPSTKENQQSKFVAIDEKLDFVQTQMEKVLNLLVNKSEIPIPKVVENLDTTSLGSRSDIDMNAIEYPYNETNRLLESKLNSKSYNNLLKQTNIASTNGKIHKSSFSHDQQGGAPSSEAFMSTLLHSQYNHGSNHNHDDDDFYETKSPDVLFKTKDVDEEDLALKSSRTFLNSLDSLKEDFDFKANNSNSKNSHYYSSTPNLTTIETPYITSKTPDNRSITPNSRSETPNHRSRSEINKAASSRKENSLRSFTKLIQKCKQMSAAVDEVVGSLDDNMNNFDERNRMYEAIQYAQSLTDSSHRELFRPYDPSSSNADNDHNPAFTMKTNSQIDRTPVFLSPSRRPPIPNVFNSSAQIEQQKEYDSSNHINTDFDEEMTYNKLIPRERRGRSRERCGSFSSGNNIRDRSRSNERSIGSRSKSPTAVRNAVPKEILSINKSPVTYSFGTSRNARVISDRIEDRFISSNYGIMKQNFSSNLNQSDKYNTDGGEEFRSRSKSPTAVRNAVPKEILSPHKSPVTYSFGTSRNARVVSDRIEDRFISSNYGIMKQNFSSNDKY